MKDEGKLLLKKDTGECITGKACGVEKTCLYCDHVLDWKKNIATETTELEVDMSEYAEKGKIKQAETVKCIVQNNIVKIMEIESVIGN